eukprot:2096353-Karenia_brevis.AAC.1
MLDNVSLPDWSVGVNEHYDIAVQNFKSAAEQCFPAKSRKKYKFYFDEKAVALVERRNTIRRIKR